VPYYVYLGAFGGKPTFSGIFSLVAFRLVEETGSDKDPKELAKAISENNFNDYADILTTIQASRPPRKNQPTYKDLCEEALDRLEQFRGFFEQGGVDKLKAFKKENGIELDKFPWNDEKALNEVLKNNETAQEVTYKALSLAYFLGSLGATIKGEEEETAHLKEELALLASKDPKAMGRASIYEGLLPTKEATAHRERQPIARASDFNAPSNNVFSDLSKLFPLFRHIVTKDSEGNPKSLSQADQDLITRAKAYEQALNNRKDNIADIKAKIKAKKAEIDQEKNNPYPDAIKVSQLQAELDTLTASRKAVNDELKELSTNILPYNGEYYTNTNTLPTRINDNGEVELSIAGIDSNTTITMPPYVAIGESAGDAGTTKDIQRADTH
jgi:DNA repair exonuclease SbcCD ATPase subunit